MKIRLFGQRNILGGGVHYSNFSDALKKIHYIGDLIESIDVKSPIEFDRGLQTSRDSDVNIWFWQHPEIEHFKGVNVVWAVFESNKLPNYLIEYYQKYAKLLWVPSQWGKEVLINNGIDETMIEVVPEGVDANQYQPYLRNSIDKTGEPFRFLSIGKFEERKGYRELLQAFRLAFDNSPEVELVIKADYFLDPENKKQQCIQLINELGLTNVKLIWGELTTVQLFELYNFADVYVTATRAEGWGLPIIEAAATGLPIIAPFYSGHTEFLKNIASSVLKIGYELDQIDDPEFMKFWPSSNNEYGRWATVDMSSLNNQLILSKETFQVLKLRAYSNSLKIRQEFAWTNVANLAIDSLVRTNILYLK
jgi:glycosyltransferase involved in cell wall biosynthesis